MGGLKVKTEKRGLNDNQERERERDSTITTGARKGVVSNPFSAQETALLQTLRREFSRKTGVFLLLFFLTWWPGFSFKVHKTYIILKENVISFLLKSIKKL